MPILKNIGSLAACSAPGGQSEIHLTPAAALAWRDGIIEWVGVEGELPASFSDYKVYDAGGALVVPGLIDCHTHLGFGGWRADEFQMRIEGRPYLEIAKAGGGIRSSMQATRAASEEELLVRCRLFLSEIIALGVTTIECKSGYGLNLHDELKTLRVYKQLNHESPLDIFATCLAAHIVPPEFADNRADYLRLIKEEIYPAVKEQKLADFADVFVEETAFTPEEAEEILEAGKAFGLTPKLHVDQLSNLEGAELAVRLGAASADHLECISDRGIEALAGGSTVAVTLPTASLYTFQSPLDVRPLIKHGIPVAVATDFNPGSAPSYNIHLAMLLACTLNRMTPAEVLKGVTLYAAQALGAEDRLGSIETGKQADFTVIDAPGVNHWLYNFREGVALATIKSGEFIYTKADGLNGTCC